MDTPIANLGTLLQAQRAAWQARTPGHAQRMDDLARLRRAFKARLEDFVRAVSADFGHRPRVETLLADGMPVLDEIDHVHKRLRRWMRTRRVAADAAFFPAHCEIVTKPLGVVGVVSPWNYPVNLALVPLVDALAAGNHVMLKPTESTPRTSALLAEVLAEVFPIERVAVVQGGAAVGAAFAALVRSSAVHRFDRGGREGAGCGRAQPDAGDAGAGRQVARDRGAGLRERPQRGADRRGQVPQCRPDLHRAGLRAGA